MAAELHEILSRAVASSERVKLGSLLAEMGRAAKLSDAEHERLLNVREREAARPVDFE